MFRTLLLCYVETSLVATFHLSFSLLITSLHVTSAEEPTDRHEGVGGNDHKLSYRECTLSKLFPCSPSSNLATSSFAARSLDRWCEAVATFAQKAETSGDQR